MKTVTRYLDLLADTTGRLVAPLTLVMVLLTCGVVIARYGFDIGAVQASELVVYLHGTVFMLGIACTLKTGGHVRVDILYQKLSVKQKALVEILGTCLFLLPLAGFLLWTSFDYVAFSWRLKEGSAEPGGLPFVYLFKTLMPIMAILLALQGISELLKAIRTLRGDTADG